MLIVVQSAYILIYFNNNKKSYHIDELLSYGLSNSFYQPFITSDSVFDSADYSKCDNEWLSSDLLKNYVTVQKGEQFRYDSVWYNQSQDRHPPLFYAAIHTVSSFFPDQFSSYFGFLLNLLYFAITQIFLYKLCKNILKSKYLALLFCMFWGFSYAALSITIFIRMYCMLVMWVVIFMYLHSKLCMTKEKLSLKQLIPIIIVTTCGALTQHIFLFVAFITAVCFCIMYLTSKKWKEFFAYGFSMLGGVLLSWVIFPPSVSQIFNETSSSMADVFFHQLVVSIKYYFFDVFGIAFGNEIIISTIIGIVLVTVVIFGLPVLFLFRNSEKLRNFINKSKKTFLNFIKGFSFRKVLLSIKKSNPMTFIIFLAGITVLSVVDYTASFFAYGRSVNRYLFVMYILITIALMSFLCWIFKKLKFKKVIMAVIVSILMLNEMCNGTTLYAFNYDNEINMTDMTNGAECIIVSDSKYHYFVLETFISDIIHSDKFFFTDIDEIDENMDNIDKLKTDKPVYLFMEYDNLEKDENGNEYFSYMIYNKKKIDKTKFLKEIQQLDISDECTYISDYKNILGTFAVYRLS